MQLILASASRGRKHLLSTLKIPFEILPTDINEDEILATTPLETIQLRTHLKGEKAIKLLSSNVPPTTYNLKPITSSLILTADTEVVVENQVIGKPKDESDAIRIFHLLSGKTHEVITAIYAIKIGINTSNSITLDRVTQVWQDYDRSFVTFKNLSDKEIKRYLSITDYTRYTGGYALLASPQDFVTKIEGSLSNVIGLPIEKVIPIFEENGLL